MAYKPGPPSAEQLAAWALDKALSHYLLVVCGAVAIAVLIWRVATSLTRHMRHIACLSNDTQHYFAQPWSPRWSWVKRNLIYAPILHKRHNREFQLSSAVNVGTLPTRMQLAFLVAYLATNVAFCVAEIPFAKDFDTAASSLVDRSGTLSVVNMVPLFLMAGRNNPLIGLLDVSFDTFNLLHRWFGRIAILEAVVHTVAFLSAQGVTKGYAAAGFETTFRVTYMTYGFVATCAFILLGIQASSIFRHAFYETFKVIHIVLAAVSVAGLWYHLKLKDLPQLMWLLVVIPIWAVERLMRVGRLVYRNFGSGGTRATVEALPGNACRITVDLARPWTHKPGQHAYLYLPAISFWQSHPFTIAWSAEADDPSGRGAGEEGGRLALNRQDVARMRRTTMSFVVRARTGATERLYRRAAANKDGRMAVRCFAEGPYGATTRLDSYGTVMLVAGGVGITHQVPYVRDLVAGFAGNTVATRRLVLVWIIQSPEHLEWIRPWMTEILAMERRREVLRIMLFVSRPRSTKEIHSPSSTVQMFPGRPNIDTLLGIEMEQQVGAMVVSVCGPGNLSDDVRRAVRDRQYQGTVDFVEEAFSW